MRSFSIHVISKNKACKSGRSDLILRFKAQSQLKGTFAWKVQPLSGLGLHDANSTGFQPWFQNDIINNSGEVQSLNMTEPNLKINTIILSIPSSL